MEPGEKYHECMANEGPHTLVILCGQETARDGCGPNEEGESVSGGSRQ